MPKTYEELAPGLRECIERVRALPPEEIPAVLDDAEKSGSPAVQTMIGMIVLYVEITRGRESAIGEEMLP